MELAHLQVRRTLVSPTSLISQILTATKEEAPTMLTTMIVETGTEPFLLILRTASLNSLQLSRWLAKCGRRFLGRLVFTMPVRFILPISTNSLGQKMTLNFLQWEKTADLCLLTYVLTKTETR